MDTSGVIYGVQTKLSELGFKAVVMAAEDVRQTTAAERKLRRGESKIEQLKRENAFLLIDARPLLHSADTEYAVSRADATLVIAECGATTGVELKRCMLLLQQLKATGVGTILLNDSDDASEAPVRRTIVPEEPRQKVPMWERTRSMMPSDLSVVPKWQDEEKTNFEVISEKFAEELPKQVQLVPTRPVKPMPMTRPEEPFMLFEEAAFVAPGSKQNVPDVLVIEQPAFVQTPVAAKAVDAEKLELTPSEPVEEKAERLKREAILRVKARFGMPKDAVEALSAAMANPVSKPLPAFVSTASISAPVPVVKQEMVEPMMVAPTPLAHAEETIFEWKEQPIQQPEPMEASPVLKQQPAAALTELPPVRRITVQQERRKPGLPVVPWAPRPERRREPIVFPRGLNKAALRMQEKGQAIAKGLAGPSLTAAQQAIANKISTTNQPVSARPAAMRQEALDRQGAVQSAEQGGRWSLLRQFGGFETEEIDAPSLQERAAG